MKRKPLTDAALGATRRYCLIDRLDNCYRLHTSTLRMEINLQIQRLYNIIEVMSDGA